MDATIRSAFQGKVEDLGLGGDDLSVVLEAVGQHTAAGPLIQYEQQLLNAGGASAALERLRAPSLAALVRPVQRSAPGTLGAAIDGVGAAVLPPDSTDVVRLRQLVRASQPVWRAVLGYGDTLLDDWALQAFNAAQTGDLEGYLWIAILFARVGFISPEAAIPVCECLADGWLRGKATLPLLGVDWRVHWETPRERVCDELGIESAPSFAGPARDADPLLRNPGAFPPQLPDLFWDVVANLVEPETITPRIAAFGGAYDAALKDACARAILRHAGQRKVADQAWPPRVDLHSLAAHPRGTLGYDFYHLIVDNGFDPEVLDPDSVTGFHPGLDGTNRRILQTHEIWHLVAGYSTSPLHETAISAFQLAQFGHNYSAIFLATAVTLLVFNAPMFLDPTLQVIAEGWRHGRATRPMMLIDWPSLWGKSIGEIRRDCGIDPFRSVIPDVMAPAAAA